MANENAAVPRDERALVLQPLSFNNGPVSPKTIVPRPSHESAVVHGRRVPNSIRAYCADFISKVIAVFGEHSPEWETIRGTLMQFNQGQLSKRSAHLAMARTLSAHEELQRGLVSILDHPDARWGAGDFDLSYAASSTPYTLPSFLEPQHQPQPPMPMISDWYHSQNVANSQPLAPSPSDAFQRARQIGLNEGPTLPQHIPDSFDNFGLEDYTIRGHNSYGGYGGHAAYNGQDNPTSNLSAYSRNTNISWNPSVLNHLAMSSPTPPMLSEPPLNRQFASPPMNNSFSATFDPTGYNMPTQNDRPPVFCRAWQDPVRNMNLEGGGSHKDEQQEQMGALTMSRRSHDAGAPLSSFDANSLAAVSPLLSLMSAQPHNPDFGMRNSGPFIFGTPTAVPLGQPAFDMAPPGSGSSKGSTVPSVADVRRISEAPSWAASDQYQGQEDTGSPATELPPRKATKRKNRVKAVQTGDSKPRASPNSGNYVHAICGRTFQNRYAVKKHHFGAKSKEEATANSCWVKHGMPDREWDEHPSCQQEEPKPFPKSRRTSNIPAPPASDSKTGIVPANNQQPKNLNLPAISKLNDLPRTVADIVYDTPALSDGIVSYGSPRVSSKDGPGMASLLTAVNAVSKLDAPKPQRRIDSIVDNLDTRPEYMPWATGNGLHHRYLLPSDQKLPQAEQLAGARAEEEQSRSSQLALSSTSVYVPQHKVLASQPKDFRTVGLEPATYAVGTEPAEHTAATVDSGAHQLDPVQPLQAEANQRGPRRVRRKVSKREVHGLGISISPGPDRKRVKANT
ncbi:hypothetical protein P280DRAFT_271385 [Massarina eburnea CBS 473.64]|uniref:Uncharacterized protein n=1 Tax=Massarina eburnea CBS 473.64 TaxID=1395130 RepID=A0A6A6S517_9PLEO|nr:hypothetical protein P280DRAFT_271385 [Massarina eburnea CBS 473.64]